MMGLRFSWQGLTAVVLAIVSTALLPLVLADPLVASAHKPFAAVAIIAMIIGAALFDATHAGLRAKAGVTFVAAHLGAWLLLGELGAQNGGATWSFYLLLVALWLVAWRCVTLLAQIRPVTNLLRFLVPALFGVWLLIFWEAIVRGAGIPFILLPPPSAIGARIASSLPILLADINQTVFKAAIGGYLIGCGAGFAVAILADRYLFLRRGLIPIGNMVSALPIIGVAPIMVMWFGFGWESKAAVVAIMTFFPMLVNTVAGLATAGAMERDLMRTYAAGYWQTLYALRLPAAMPFIFNALKINSTLAMIGAIVAEFFGTPVVGMGFRISTEVGRMNVDMVWAEIAAAAVVGSLFYGILALIERSVTFWHPSVRGG
jgi:NitT/TauT family transport system permease protein